MVRLVVSGNHASRLVPFSPVILVIVHVLGLVLRLDTKRPVRQTFDENCCHCEDVLQQFHRVPVSYGYASSAKFLDRFRCRMHFQICHEGVVMIPV